MKLGPYEILARCEPISGKKRLGPTATLVGRSTSMGFDKKEMIEQLKFEIEMIEKGGFEPY
jgi:hypothetical protein